MKKYFEILSLFFAFFSSVAGAAELTDATTAVVHVPSHPLRIVTLAPSLGELVSELTGSSQQLVGVSEYSDFPVELKNIKTVGPYTHFNLEEVIMLKPDIVFATADGNSKDQIGHLRELGVPVLVVATETFKQIENSITLIATALGKAKEGLSLIEKLHAGLKKVAEQVLKRNSKAPKKRVLIQLGDDPLTVVGQGSFLHEAIGLTGAVNVYADSRSHYPRPSIEDVVQKDPDVILILALTNDLNSFETMAKKWERYSKLKSVAGRNIRILHADTLLRPTGRILEGLRLLMEGVYGRE